MHANPLSQIFNSQTEASIYFECSNSTISKFKDSGNTYLGKWLIYSKIMSYIIIILCMVLLLAVKSFNTPLKGEGALSYNIKVFIKGKVFIKTCNFNRKIGGLNLPFLILC